MVLDGGQGALSRLENTAAPRALFSVWLTWPISLLRASETVSPVPEVLGLEAALDAFSALVGGVY
ncbi:hypothetical protein AOA80_07125 [Methanomassiliicoccales archaeon RumEn M1]|nr:hypothetical protein AOA80_07125 [Methanomassiliicoccales archaeon RumEn M1]